MIIHLVEDSEILSPEAVKFCHDSYLRGCVLTWHTTHLKPICPHYINVQLENRINPCPFKSGLMIALYNIGLTTHRFDLDLQRLPKLSGPCAIVDEQEQEVLGFFTNREGCKLFAQAHQLAYTKPYSPYTISNMKLNFAQYLP